MGARAYALIAGWYDTLLEPLLASAKARGREMYAPPAGGLVVDVGCGTGAQLARYRGGEWRLAGVDPSPEMVAQARRALGGDAEIHLADASRMPFAGGSVDLVLCSMALHEMAGDTRRAVLREIRRVLRADGALLVLDYRAGPRTTPRSRLLFGGIVVVERLAGRDHYRHFRQFMAAGGVPALAAAHEFRIEAVRPVKSETLALYLLRPA